MQLENYISDLLYRYECVTIPNFGAFLTQSTPAKINTENNTLSAPRKMVAFNEQLQNNDGLLARYIADVEFISFEAALSKINTSVLTLKRDLAEGKTITFKNVGTLGLNTHQKIEFDPTNQLNYLTDSFGLFDVISPAISREVLKVAETSKTLKHIPEAQLAKAAKNSTRKASVKMLLVQPLYKYAAVAAVVLSLGGVIGSSYINRVESYNEVAQQDANKQLESQIQQATFVISNPLPTATLKINKRSGVYHIIVGAHRDRTNAFKEVQALRNANKEAWIDANEHGYFNVVHSSYKKRIDALIALEAIRDNYNEDAWIYVKNLD